MYLRKLQKFSKCDSGHYKVPNDYIKYPNGLIGKYEC